jgi:hypothetical protein
MKTILQTEASECGLACLAMVAITSATAANQATTLFNEKAHAAAGAVCTTHAAPA